MNAVTDATVLWWIVLGIGVVVTLCVVVLLSLLTAFVGDIKQHVDSVAAALQHVAANTETHAHVATSANLINALGLELQMHERALSGRKGPL